MEFHERLKELRKREKLTQPKLATELGMSLDSIKKMETGKMKPSIETLEKMSDYFNVSTDYLLGRGVNPKIDIARIMNNIGLKNVQTTEYLNSLPDDPKDYTEAQFDMVDKIFKILNDTLEAAIQLMKNENTKDP